MRRERRRPPGTSSAANEPQRRPLPKTANPSRDGDAKPRVRVDPDSRVTEGGVAFTPREHGGLPQEGDHMILKGPAAPLNRARPALLLGLGVVLCGVLLVTTPGRTGTLDTSWTASTTNTDGSPLTDLAFYRIYYATSGPPCPGSSFFEVAASAPNPSPNQTVTVRLTGLSVGVLYSLSVSAVDAIGNESACFTPEQSA